MIQIKAARTFTHGIAEGKAYILRKKELIAADHFLGDEEVESELNRFSEAIEKVTESLTELAEQSEIFAGHLSIANDFALHEAVQEKISDQKMNAEMATDQTISEFKAMMEAIDDEYMRERASDIGDVGRRFMLALKNETSGELTDIHEPVIIVAEDLTPTDTSVMDFQYVKGFITAKGGVTSHVSIIARSLGIPALVGVDEILEVVSEDDFILFDAGSGEIWLNPDADLRETMMEKAREEAREAEEIQAKSALPATSLDGRTVKVYANIGSVQDAKNAMEFKIDGVGLFRSEFLFMDNTDFPTEEEQFNAYKEAVETIGNEVIIRTLDIGGDKDLSYFTFEKEENPFLGWRAIRMCLSEKDMFKTQLRALFRAAHYGPIKIMIPMVISVEEVEEVRAIGEECKAELRAEGLPFNENTPIGIMVETPAAVLCADALAKHVDFFSIGTNDLTQYVLAVDRGNKRIEDLYNTFHPAVMRAIAQVIKAGNEAGIEVGMCGEFASNEHATEVLLGMGLDEYSMAASETARVKERIRGLDFAQAKEKAARVLQCTRVSEVYEVLGIKS